MNRRDFLATTGRHAAAAVAAASPVLAATAAAGSRVHDRLADQLRAAREALEQRIDSLSGEVGALAGRVDQIEFHHQLLLLLLLLSFVVDGGLAWMLATAPVAPLA
jgi:hypothetical protein